MVIMEVYTPCVLTCREGIDLVLNSRVASVSRNMVTVVDAKKERDQRHSLWRLRLGHRRCHAPPGQAAAGAHEFTHEPEKL